MPFEAFDVEGRTSANRKTHLAGFQMGVTSPDNQQAREDAIAWATDYVEANPPGSPNGYHRVVILGPTELETRDDEDDLIWDSRVNMTGPAE